MLDTDEISSIWNLSLESILKSLHCRAITSVELVKVSIMAGIGGNPHIPHPVLYYYRIIIDTTSGLLEKD
jgi:hypothetical protein